MNIDKGLCCAIIFQQEIKSVIDAGIKKEHLFEPWDATLDKIITHFLTHKVIPSKDAIFQDGSFEEPKDTLDYYIDEVHKRTLQSGLTTGIRSVVGLIKNEQPELALKELQRLSLELDSDHTSVGSVTNIFSAESLDEFLAKYEKRKAAGGPDGLLTPWPGFNSRSYGFQPEEVIVIAGKKKSKKTFVGLAITHGIWKNKVEPVLIVSMEMSIHQMLQRLLAFDLKTPYDLLRKSKLPDLEEKSKLDQIRALRDGPGILVTDVTRVQDTQDLEMVCAQIKPKFVFVDGLYILRPTDRQLTAQHEKVGGVIKDMCRIAARHHLTILSTTQFNRKVKYGHMVATTDEIAASDSIGQFCHCCLGLFPNTKEEVHGPTAIVRTLAAREFMPINILINYNLETMDFSEIRSYDKEEDDEDGSEPPMVNKNKPAAPIAPKDSIPSDNLTMDGWNNNAN